MNKGLGIVMLVVGLALVVSGLYAANLSSEVARTLAGNSDKTLWLLLGGIISSIVGVLMSFSPSGNGLKRH